MSYKRVWVFAFAIAAQMLMPQALAAVFNVDTIVDDAGLVACDDATSNDCSLRGAITKANGLSEPVTINVPSGTYVLTQITACFYLGNNSIASVATLALCPTGTLTIVGAGVNTTIIDANQPSGGVVIAPVVFVASTAKVAIRGITMRKGNFSGGSVIGHGGGINNAGTLVLEDSAVTDSFTSDKGGGIYNQGDLTLLRSLIARNFAAHEGGGISNTCRFDVCTGGVLKIADSNISQNTAGNVAGGIANFFGTVTVSGTTISSNVGAVNGNGGGGIWNNNFTTMILTNVTVSGNRSASGGGILNSGNLFLNNVTITNNTAQWETDPGRGDGGGLYNGGSVALQNTIIAGNIAAGPVPSGADCLAGINTPLTSKGYSLIQNVSACAITGDVTGNILGQDPQLGVLAQNDGVTPTHALAAGSPAVDAGSPATPGSGGTACPVTDQRGLFRPLGATCDIGAFEHSGVFGLASVSPPRGGNVGQVSVQVGGSGFVNGASVKLSRSGQPDIPATLLQVDIGGAAIAATFDLRGRSLGAWDLVVTNPDSSSRTLPASFTIQPGVGPDLWVDVIGMIRRPRGVSFVTIWYGNRGDVDALAVPLSISLPQGYQATREFAITPPPAQNGEVRPDWRLVSPVIAAQSATSLMHLPLLLPIVPSGFSGVLRIDLALPQNALDSVLVASIGNPHFGTSPNPGFIADAAAGAQAYLQQVFSITMTAPMLVQVQQYATSKFQQLVADGQAAFAATLGTQPQIYSLAQMQLDLAFYAAPRAANAVAKGSLSAVH
jgi:hypothetical protein